MTKFLDVYNAFDEAKLAAILARPVDPREHDELAGYKALHGTCTAFKQTKALPEMGPGSRSRANAVSSPSTSTSPAARSSASSGARLE